MTKDKHWPIKKALEYANSRGVETTMPTVIKWVREHNLGFQLSKGGKWYIYQDKFKRYIDGGKTKTKDTDRDVV